MSEHMERSFGSMVQKSIVVLETLRDSNVPVGARRIGEIFASHGIDTSESSVSRMLRNLDGQGWTRSAGTKGRVLTKQGLVELRRLEGIRKNQDVLPLDVRSLRSLHDLLTARRAVERESVRSAAQNISREDIRHLRKVTEEHQQLIDRGEVTSTVGVLFHRLLGAYSGNKFLSSMTDLVFDSSLDSTEAILDIVVGRHMTESLSVKEHNDLLDAIELHDPDQAEERMLAHMDRLISDVAAFRESNQEQAFDRLMQLSLDNSGGLGFSDE